jgi:hypothetical protein
MTKRRTGELCKCGNPAMPDRVRSHNYCRVCFAREARRREKMRLWRKEHHTPCAKCGESRLLYLEFAHLAGPQKQNEVTRVRTVSQAAAELPLVRSLCVLCHRRETLESRPVSARRRRLQAVSHRVLLDTYGGRCQCGWAQCDVRVTNASDDAQMQLMEWDHQPSNSDSKVDRLSELVRRKPHLVAHELTKCVPLYRPHHLAVTRYRRDHDPTYTVKPNTLAPDAIARMLEERVTDHTRRMEDISPMGTPF